MSHTAQTAEAIRKELSFVMPVPIECEPTTVASMQRGTPETFLVGSAREAKSADELRRVGQAWRQRLANQH